MGRDATRDVEPLTAPGAYSGGARSARAWSRLPNAGNSASDRGTRSRRRRRNALSIEEGLGAAADRKPFPAGYPNGGQLFYGSSFIADHRGDLVAALGREDEGVLTAEFDLDFLATHRAAWGFFRDRRTDLYGALTQGRPA